MSMATIDDAAILKRAKELCAKDNTMWEQMRDNRATLDQAGRRKYLSLARDQLIEESSRL